MGGGFPEPHLADSVSDAQRWRRQYIDGLIREDILSFENITQLHAMETLVQLLRGRVGSPISYQSLAEDLAIATNTVKHYLEILEALYIVFRVYPYHRSIARSIKQQAKRYFSERYPIPGIQLVADLRLEDHSGSIPVRRLYDYISTFQ